MASGFVSVAIQFATESTREVNVRVVGEGKNLDDPLCRLETRRVAATAQHQRLIAHAVYEAT